VSAKIPLKGLANAALGSLGLEVYTSVRNAALKLENLKALANTPFRDFFNSDQVYVFHHIPRSGGTSVTRVIRNWFWVVRDYRPGGERDQSFFENRKDVSSLKNYKCLAGHFGVDGCYLCQRYPEMLTDDRFRIFTFVRDPLETKISLYYYEKKHGLNVGVTLEEHLMGRPNYIANRLPCTKDNYRSVLDRYYFVGITELAQESLDKLADLVCRPRIKVSVVNRADRDEQVSALSPAVMRRFRSENELDYLIYEYCLEKARAY